MQNGDPVKPTLFTQEKEVREPNKVPQRPILEPLRDRRRGKDCKLSVTLTSFIINFYISKIG